MQRLKVERSYMSEEERRNSMKIAGKKKASTGIILTHDTFLFPFTF